MFFFPFGFLLSNGSMSGALREEISLKVCRRNGSCLAPVSFATLLLKLELLVSHILLENFRKQQNSFFGRNGCFPPFFFGHSSYKSIKRMWGGVVKSAPHGGWTCCSEERTHPPCGAHPQSMDCGRPCAVGRGQFPHRYKPRSVLPPTHG